MAIWAEITEGIAKVPPVEQLVATAAATQNMLNALHAKGYGAILVTGAPCYDEAVKAALGLAAKDHLLGFVHIGTPNGTAAGKQRPAPAEFLREWHGPAELAAE